ncbi:MAG: hypothetical protein GTO40_29120, partial [Deltaproteobacteria bacterium]|nr:hypothetical protein [Deltaproteobacteria bacterium]
MQPKLELLPNEVVTRVIDEAYQLLEDLGVKVQSLQARQLLAEGGAQVDETSEVVKIPRALAAGALETTPRHFSLYNRMGDPVVTYGGDAVHFDPGSSGVHVLDAETLEHRPS